MMPKRPSGTRILFTLVLAASSLPALWLVGLSTSFAANDQPQAASCGGDAALKGFFKGATGGMKVKDKAELYDEKGLFNYIDGGAPLYIKHHFRRLGAAEMVTDNGGEMTCDTRSRWTPKHLPVFSMNCSNAAFSCRSTAP